MVQNVCHWCIELVFLTLTRLVNRFYDYNVKSDKPHSIQLNVMLLDLAMVQIWVLLPSFWISLDRFLWLSQLYNIVILSTLISRALLWTSNKIIHVFSNLAHGDYPINIGLALLLINYDNLYQWDKKPDSVTHLRKGVLKCHGLLSPALINLSGFVWQEI